MSNTTDPASTLSAVKSPVHTAYGALLWRMQGDVCQAELDLCGMLRLAVSLLRYLTSVGPKISVSV